MKICKVKIIKEFDGYKADWSYPDGYDASKISIIAYEEKPMAVGKNVGFCIGRVADDFVLGPGMTEIDVNAARAFIDARAVQETTPEAKSRIKRRKELL